MQRRVRTLWTDLNGLTHGRYIPSARFDHATHHAVTTLVMSPQGEILPVAGYAGDVGFPDLAAVPLAATRRPGWEPDTDVAICELRGQDGQPLPLCPRGALARAVDGWRALGFEPQLGFELELYVLERATPPARGGRPAARATACTASGSAAIRPAWRSSSSTPSRRWTSSSRACSPSSRPGRWRSTSATARRWRPPTPPSSSRR